MGGPESHTSVHAPTVAGVALVPQTLQSLYLVKRWKLVLDVTVVVALTKATKKLLPRIICCHNIQLLITEIVGILYHRMYHILLIPINFTCVQRQSASKTCMSSRASQYG